MARDRRERLDDNGLPIGEYGDRNDEYTTLSRTDLLRRCREQRERLDALDLERKAMVDHIARLRGEEPGDQEDAPARGRWRR